MNFVIAFITIFRPLSSSCDCLAVFVGIVFNCKISADIELLFSHFVLSVISHIMRDITVEVKTNVSIVVGCIVVLPISFVLLIEIYSSLTLTFRRRF